MKNVLILNAGTRNKLIQYFKKEINGKGIVIATDSYYLAPALLEADKCYVTKRWDEFGYWDEIFKICDENNVGLVISLIDSELVDLASNVKKFNDRGIMVNSSSESIVSVCFDKYETYKFSVSHGYPTIKTYICSEELLNTKGLEYPLFLKPICGSGSAGLNKAESYSELHDLINKYGNKNYIVQEYMDCKELGVDVYVDLISNEVVSIFAKEKLKMRAGETDKSVSYKDTKLFEIIKKYVEDMGLKGANDIDVFLRNGEYYISEVNPRFGGGYLHAYECGVNFPAMLINNMNGIINKKQIGNYDEKVYMMKYFDIKIMK